MKNWIKAFELAIVAFVIMMMVSVGAFIAFDCLPKIVGIIMCVVILVGSLTLMVKKSLDEKI